MALIFQTPHPERLLGALWAATRQGSVFDKAPPPAEDPSTPLRGWSRCSRCASLPLQTLLPTELNERGITRVETDAKRHLRAVWVPLAEPGRLVLSLRSTNLTSDPAAQYAEHHALLLAAIQSQLSESPDVSSAASTPAPHELDAWPM